MNLISHIQECYSFIPAKRIWDILCSDEVENIVLLAIIGMCLYTIVDCSWFFAKEMGK